MKHLMIVSILFFVLQSCDRSVAVIELAHDKLNYESVTGATGSVFVRRGEIPHVYDSAQIIYSKADATNMLIKTKEGKYVYIQGPAVVEFDTFNANDRN